MNDPFFRAHLSDAFTQEIHGNHKNSLVSECLYTYSHGHPNGAQTMPGQK